MPSFLWAVMAERGAWPCWTLRGLPECHLMFKAMKTTEQIQAACFLSTLISTVGGEGRRHKLRRLIRAKSSLGKHLLDSVSDVESHRNFQSYFMIHTSIFSGFELYRQIGPLKCKCLNLAVSDSIPHLMVGLIPGPMVHQQCRLPTRYSAHLSYIECTSTSNPVHGPATLEGIAVLFTGREFPSTALAAHPFSMNLEAKALVISFLGSEFTLCLDCLSLGVSVQATVISLTLHYIIMTSPWWTDPLQGLETHYLISVHQPLYSQSDVVACFNFGTAGPGSLCIS